MRLPGKASNRAYWYFFTDFPALRPVPLRLKGNCVRIYQHDCQGPNRDRFMFEADFKNMANLAP
jgi:hypothetical protein